ncbi:MAG: aldo/keto reductase [Gammaproteobacteria bacterium]|nr:aldo/keto reductase [Gammaproteobacteria bacterium]
MIRFGRTGLKVCPLSFGTMTLGEPVDEKTSFRLLDLAFERGANFIDCANMYNAGLAEMIVGKWLAALGNRDRVIISSKVRYRVGDDPLSEGLAPATIERELERSLERLDTDYLDIYFLHQPDYDTPIDVTWQCLDRLARAGALRYVGLSNFAAWQVVEADGIAKAAGWIRPTVVQAMYNLIARYPDAELMPMSRALDLGVCNYNPLAGGLFDRQVRHRRRGGRGPAVPQRQLPAALLRPAPARGRRGPLRSSPPTTAAARWSSP